jgi:hypothetical protein
LAIRRIQRQQFSRHQSEKFKLRRTSVTRLGRLQSQSLSALYVKAANQLRRRREGSNLLAKYDELALGLVLAFGAFLEHRCRKFKIAACDELNFGRFRMTIRLPLMRDSPTGKPATAP